MFFWNRDLIVLIKKWLPVSILLPEDYELQERSTKREWIESSGAYEQEIFYVGHFISAIKKMDSLPDLESCPPAKISFLLIPIDGGSMVTPIKFCCSFISV